MDEERGEICADFSGPNMKHITCTILLGMAIAAALIAAGAMLLQQAGKALERQARAECNDWNRQGETNRLFYNTDAEREQCRELGVTLTTQTYEDYQAKLYRQH